MNIKNTALLTRGFFLAAMLSFGVGSAVPAHGATVVFSGMTDQQGNPLNADVSLNMAAQPIYNGTGLSFGDWVTYPMTNYTVTVSNLIGGYYMMSMPGLKKQLILSVPNSTNTYQFMSLVTNVLSTIYQSINYFNGTNFVSVYSTNGFGGLLISGDTNPANLNITLSQSLDALSKQQFSWLKTTNANSTGFWIMSTPGSSDGGLSISLDYDLSKGIAIQPATVSSNLYQHDSTTIGMLPGCCCRRL